jgi:hypothetical protein
MSALPSSTSAASTDQQSARSRRQWRTSCRVSRRRSSDSAHCARRRRSSSSASRRLRAAADDCRSVATRNSCRWRRRQQRRSRLPSRCDVDDRNVKRRDAREQCARAAALPHAARAATTAPQDLAACAGAICRHRPSPTGGSLELPSPVVKSSPKPHARPSKPIIDSTTFKRTTSTYGGDVGNVSRVVDVDAERQSAFGVASQANLNVARQRSSNGAARVVKPAAAAAAPPLLQGNAIRETPRKNRPLSRFTGAGERRRPRRRRRNDESTQRRRRACGRRKNEPTPVSREVR